MHIESLRCFLYIVEEKSISKAAVRAHISQSAASQMLHKLEEELGYELLTRSNKGVSLTPRGEIALKYIQKIYKNYDNMLLELKEYDANNHKIRISGTPSLSSYSLPCMIYRIKKKFPDFQYQLAAKPVEMIIAEIKEGLMDFGFIDEVWPENPELIYNNLGHEKVVLVAKSDYRVKDAISLKELIKVELIMCSSNQKICDRLDAALKPLGKKRENLNVIFSADSMTAVKSSVLKGYGMAFVPYESVKRELYEKSVKLIAVEHLDLYYDICMVSKIPMELSQSAQLSRDYLLAMGQKSFC